MSVSGSVASSPLQAAEVWVDLNGDGIHQAQEPLTQTEPDGSFRLAVPADLLAADGAGADRLPLVASGGIDSLSGQPMGGLRLLGTSGDGALTPLTTLASLLRLGGSEEARIQALQRVFGASLTSGDPALASFDPYAALLAEANTAQARRQVQVAFLSDVLARFYPREPASLRAAVLSGYQRLAEAYDGLEARAGAAGADADRFRALLEGSAAIKSTQLSLLNQRWAELLAGGLSPAAWLAELNTSLARGGVAAALLSEEHRVRVVALSEGVLAGGTALLELRLGHPAPAQGLGVQVFVEAPAGSQLEDGSPAAGAHQLTISGGSSTRMLAIRIPGSLSSPATLRVNLLAADSGFGANPAASLAVLTIAVPGHSAVPVPEAGIAVDGTARNDLLWPQQAPALVHGGAGAVPRGQQRRFRAAGRRAALPG